MIVEEIAMLLFDVIKESREVYDKDLLMPPRHSHGICKPTAMTTRQYSRRSRKKAPKLVLCIQGSERFFESIYAALEGSKEGNSGKEEEGGEGNKVDLTNSIGGGGSSEDLQ